MNIRELKELIANLPDDALVLQETGDHDLWEPTLSLSSTSIDSKYGMIEDWAGIIESRKPALIIR